MRYETLSHGKFADESMKPLVCPSAHLVCDLTEVAVSNGTVTMREFPVGDQVMTTCDEGFELFPAHYPTRRCIDGTWSLPEQRCVECKY